MTLSIASDWKGGRWDCERLIRDLFMFQANTAAQWITGLLVEPWMAPPDAREEWLAEGNAYLLVHRMTGHAERGHQQWLDISIMALGVLTESRDTSNEVMAYVADMLFAFDEWGIVHRETPHRSGLDVAYMKTEGEVAGPQGDLSALVGDNRLVTSTWDIRVDRPRGLPEYRELMHID